MITSYDYLKLCGKIRVTVLYVIGPIPRAPSQDGSGFGNDNTSVGLRII